MYKLTLQGDLVKLQVTAPQLSSCPDPSAGINPFYDDEDAVRLPGGVRGYQHPGDAFRAFVRAYERRREHLSKVARGRIKEFSKRSRHRLLSLTARLHENVQGVLVTFTYRSNMQDYETSKAHLDLVLRYLKYHYPQAAALWRMEHQRRGAIHYHVMLLSLQSVWVDVNGLRAYWRELVGEVANIDVKWVDSRRRALGYVAKYVAKVSDDSVSELQDGEEILQGDRTGAGGSLDSMPYSENGDSTGPGAAAQQLSEFTSEAASEAPACSSFVGRFWGVSNRRVLPFAEEHVFVFSDAFTFEYVELRARRELGKSPFSPCIVQGKREGVCALLPVAVCACQAL